MIKKAVVLLSGGIDSSTTLAIAKSMDFQLFAISFDYRQRHQVELKAAKQVAKQIGVEKHLIIDIALSKIGGSALTDTINVPKNRDTQEMAANIPVTYVPARNIIFLSIALGWAESIGSSDIFIGANVVDFSGYPDCRPEFIRSFQTMANLGTKAGSSGQKFKIHTPLSKLTKAEIIKKGLELGVDYSLTLSCYDPSADGKACGHCDSCLLRKKGFAEEGVDDPTVYK